MCPDICAHAVFRIPFGQVTTTGIHALTLHGSKMEQPSTMVTVKIAEGFFGLSVQSDPDPTGIDPPVAAQRSAEQT
jgi:hypothetical protein